MESLKEEQIFYSNFEPKINRRFIVHFTDPTECYLPPWVVCSIERPKFCVTKTQYKNKINWHPIRAILYDPIVPSSAQAVMQNILDNKTFKLVINVLGPAGDKVEEWEMTGCRFSHVDFGTLDWRTIENGKIEQVNCSTNVSGTPLLIEVEIQYDCATLKY